MVPFALFREQEDAQGHACSRRSSSAAECRWPSTATGIACSNWLDPSRLRAGTTVRGRLRAHTVLPEHLRSWASSSSWPIRRRRRVGWNVRGTPSRTVWSPRCASRARRPLRSNRMLMGLPAALRSAVRRPPAQQASAYRQLPPDVSLEAVLCFKYLRTVAHDNTIRFNSAALQLLPDGLRASYARARVEVQERLDGSIVVVHRGRTVATKRPPPNRSCSGRRSGRAFQRPTPSRLAPPDGRHRTRRTDGCSPPSGGDPGSYPHQASTHPSLEESAADIIIEQQSLTESLDNDRNARPSRHSSIPPVIPAFHPSFQHSTRHSSGGWNPGRPSGRAAGRGTAEPSFLRRQEPRSPSCPVGKHGR